MLTRQEIEKEYQAILSQLSDPEVVSNWEKFENLTENKNRLEKLLEKISALEDFEKQIAENETIISAGEDFDLTTLAKEETQALREKTRTLKVELENLFGESAPVKKGKSSTAAIVEIRAGVGGEEAALFAQDLFRMYSGFARSQGWQLETLDSSRTELGGLKEIIFELKSGTTSQARDVFAKMKYEGGVHRVQRIPDTEKSGRVHTSTITVAVLLKPKEIGGLKTNPSDLKIDFFNASGPGGQNVNKRKTAVRIVHLPSGMTVTSRTERNQMQNKENALAILAARLLEHEVSEEERKVSGTRRSQIGRGKRAEKIRTYNFPQDRITDHRVKKSWHNLEGVLEGKLDSVIDELQKEYPEY
ncbi:MAG: peptide chain release factor 1 [Candidatus Wildermuthbacteria bacterium GWA2_46_15]|uniref:Peptide chain release factor 1 n=1 Tax=Candidatus Wildermuthbacteria bacterium GWA2_46_15 TaxID=1802443 RepID=A0A1G2QQL5_9BACT|nr:MAG: peptide chain release factor 1 [Candidatus Wildermuthbacteria bacterium GWA2_46_15]